LKAINLADHTRLLPRNPNEINPWSQFEDVGGYYNHIDWCKTMPVLMPLGHSPTKDLLCPRNSIQ